MEDRHIFGDMPGCTADYLMVSGKLDIKKRPPVWLYFGGPIQESFKRWLAGKLAAYKRQDKLCVIELFSALGFRETSADGRPSGGESYVWETSEYKTRKDAFFSPEGAKMQIQLLNETVRIAKKSGCRFKLSFMWEAQTLAGDARFVPWLKGMVALADSLGIGAGVHSHVKAHYKAAHFVVYEGDSAKDLHLTNIGKTVYCLRRNVSPFLPGKKKANFKKSKEALLRLLQGQMIDDIKAIGCTAQPFDRYLIQRVLDNEIGENDFNCGWFKKEMEIFILNISKELKKYRGKEELPRDFGQEFVYRRETKPDPTPAPAIEDKEEKIKIAPLPELQPVVNKENNMSNTEYWRHLLRTWPRRWWHKLIPLPVGLLLAILIQVGWIQWWTMPIATIILFFIDGIVERRKMKEDRQKYRFLSTDGSEGEILEPFAKTPKCPGE